MVVSLTDSRPNVSIDDKEIPPNKKEIDEVLDAVMFVNAIGSIKDGDEEGFLEMILKGINVGTLEADG